LKRAAIAAGGGPCDGGILSAAPPCAGVGGARGRWILAATVLGSSLAFIDSTVVTVALPVLQERLGATVAQAQWVVESYLLFLSALVLVGGSVGDRAGRRKIFLLGTALFAISSAACGLAPSVAVLVGARAVQGIAAALLVPTSLAILGASFSESQRGRAVGLWSGLTSMAAALGPIAGGWLVQRVSWRAAFFLNVPIAAAVLWIAWKHVPESRSPDAGPPDVGGAVLASIGLGAVVFGLLEAPEHGWWSGRVSGSLAAGIAALGGFAAAEVRGRHPMVPPSIFRSRAFIGVNGLTFFLYGAFSGALFFFPFVLIQAHGYSPAAAGAALLPLVGLLSLLSGESGAVADRFGARPSLVAGPAVAAAGFFLLGRPGLSASYAAGFLPALCVLGFGMAISVAPLTAEVLDSAPPGKSGLASGVNNAVARVAGLLAIAVLGIIAGGAFNRSLDRRLTVSAIAPSRAVPPVERSKLGAAQPAPGLSPRQRDAARAAIAGAVVDAFRALMWIAVAMSALASAFALFGVRSTPGAEADSIGTGTRG
jgi:EmrB/QacA subfamily drug resistance transporter